MPTLEAHEAVRIHPLLLRDERAPQGRREHARGWPEAGRSARSSGLNRGSSRGVRPSTAPDRGEHSSRPTRHNVRRCLIAERFAHQPWGNHDYRAALTDLSPKWRSASHCGCSYGGSFGCCHGPCRSLSCQCSCGRGEHSDHKPDHTGLRRELHLPNQPRLRGHQRVDVQQRCGHDSS